MDYGWTILSITVEAMCCINWTTDLIVIILIDFVLWTKYVCTLDMNYVFRFRISHCVLEFLICCTLRSINIDIIRPNSPKFSISFHKYIISPSFSNCFHHFSVKSTEKPARCTEKPAGIPKFRNFEFENSFWSKLPENREISAGIPFPVVTEIFFKNENVNPGYS